MNPRVTRWFRRDEQPVRKGLYECHCRIAGGAHVVWPNKLEWDGVGFLVPIPMRVIQWRGLAKEPK